MKGARIEYDGEAAGARQDFESVMSEQTAFSNPELLRQNNVQYPKYGNPCELYSVALDGNTMPFPVGASAIHRFGIWSKQLTNAAGLFDEPITLTATADDTYTSSGISFVFDENSGIYANNINIKWYRDSELLASENYTPNSTNYFCNRLVERYNKFVVTFYGTNIPYNRLRLHNIIFGVRTTFTSEELSAVKIIQEINPVSSELPANICDFSINSKRNVDFVFESHQPISVYFGDEFIMRAFVSEAKRNTFTTWNISCEDYIGLMENTAYVGGMYTNVYANELLQHIFATAKIPVDISNDFASDMVSGYIPYTTCREAVMQVAIAIGAIVDTSYSDRVKIYRENPNVIQTIPKERIMQGQKIAESAIVTAVEVHYHAYVASMGESVVAYDSADSGWGDGIIVRFAEPLHDLIIYQGQIIESNPNYAIINAEDGCTLEGFRYSHTQNAKQKSNPLTRLTDVENVVSIQNATLISANNVDKVLEKCYDYYIRNKTTSAKIVEKRADTAAQVGDYIEIETEYSGNVEGQIAKATFSLFGGTVLVKDVEIK